MTSKSLSSIISSQFRLPLDSTHGMLHWRRVEALGSYLSESTGADKYVVSLFAYLHDSQRTNDHEDPLHGVLASEYVESLCKQGLITATQQQLSLLITACKIHTTQHVDPLEKTISTCLDADRLDLMRFNIVPSEKMLFSASSKEISRNMRIYDEIVARSQQLRL